MKYDYAYEVGRTRVKELALLTTADYDKLISAAQEAEVQSILSSHEYDASLRYDDMLKAKREALNAYMHEIVPDMSQTSSLFVGNDFAAAKKALRDRVAGKKSAPPQSECVYGAEKIYESIQSLEFDGLPDELRDPVKQAYEILTRTGSAYLSDTVLDKARFEAEISLAEKSGSKTFLELARLDAASGIVKALIRALRAGKDSSVIDDVYVKTKGLDGKRLQKSYEEGEDAFKTYVAKTPYAFMSAALDAGDVEFERACDDRRRDLLEECRAMPFGIEPLAAYYIAVLTEIMNVRIILESRRLSLEPDRIRERIRRSYA